jgi:hypothetical protein
LTSAAATPTSVPDSVMVTCRPALLPGLVGFQVSGWPDQFYVDGMEKLPPVPTVMFGVTQAIHLSSTGRILASLVR